MVKQDGVQRRDRRGVVLIAVTGLIFVLLAFAGLGFDVGYMQWSRRRAQTAADAAAVSGAWAVQMGGAVTTEGKAASAVNGFTDGASGVTVTIHNPPSSGSYTGNSTAVEALVSQDPPSYFMRVLGYNTLPVRARAVAMQGLGGACVYALNPTASSALKFAGNVTVNLGCGVIDDSAASAATKVSGNTIINMTNGASIGTVGGNSLDGGAAVSPSTAISSGVIPAADPLSTLPMPTPSLGTPCFDGTSMITGPCTSNGTLASGSYSPGVYCGGITIGSGINVNFSPGLYIIAGGSGLRMTAGTVTANGVTFYITDASGWPCSGLNGSAANAGSVSVNSQANLTLTAPTDGTYAGMALFENRNLTANKSSDATINGGAGLTIDGAIYFPNSNLSFAGTSDSNGYLMLIAQTVTFTGTTTMTLNNFPAAFASNNPGFKKWIVMAE
jgi:Predicted membrane protein (DUF2134).